jgi:hypothetical protein
LIIKAIQRLDKQATGGQYELRFCTIKGYFGEHTIVGENGTLSPEYAKLSLHYATIFPSFST